MKSLAKGYALTAGFNGGNGHGTKLLEEEAPSKIKLALAERAKQLVELRQGLEEAQRKRAEAEATRREVLVAAKADHDPAVEAKLKHATSALTTAERDEADLAATIAQVERKITELETALRAAECRRIEEEIVKLAVSRLRRAPEIDRHIEAAVRLIAESIADGEAMWSLASGIGIDGRLFDSRRGLVGFLHATFNRIFPHDFPRDQAHDGNTFAEVERTSIGGYLERFGMPLPMEKQANA